MKRLRWRGTSTIPKFAICPLCRGRPSRQLLASDVNHHTTDARFRYMKCGSCRSWFMQPVPSDLSPYYPRTYYARRPVDVTCRLDLVLRHQTAGTLTEVGPGAGHFLRAARDAGFIVQAVERDVFTAERMRNEVGAVVVTSSDPRQALGALRTSDVVVMFHVLEHVGDPWATLEAASENLCAGGHLILSMPNPNALSFKLMGARWPHLDAPRHMYLIPYEELCSAASRAGLRPVSVTGGDDDARMYNQWTWTRAALLLTARFPSPVIRARLSHYALLALTTMTAPLERRGLRSSTYTAVFVRD
jgi:SAM-dependent methyltransferase